MWSRSSPSVITESHFYYCELREPEVQYGFTVPGQNSLSMWLQCSFIVLLCSCIIVLVSLWCSKDSLSFRYPYGQASSLTEGFLRGLKISLWDLGLYRGCGLP